VASGSPALSAAGRHRRLQTGGLEVATATHAVPEAAFRSESTRETILPAAPDRSASTEQALLRVARRFAPAARDIILYENRYKHLYEVRRILEAAGTGGAVCDLGGGLGVNLLTLRELGCSGRLVLIDQFDEYDEDNRMGEWRSAVTMLQGAGIEVVRADFWSEWRLPLAGGACDVATCLDVVEHLPGHPLRQLGELRRILRPGGACLISGPNGVSLMKRVKALLGRYPYSPLEEWLTEPYYEHYREYTRAEYEELLRRAGFADVASHASAAVTRCRARFRFHRTPLRPLSPRLPLLWGLAAVEALLPGVRHGVYAWGTAPSA
jgi:SAM-dependent methyltransferase